MFVSFFTARVILEALGINDFGIYNVVGGFVALFSMISGSLSAACTRFLNYTLGKNDPQQLSKVFSTELAMQLVLSIIVIIISETFGIWFLSHKMVIPTERLFAANVCFQFSIFNFCVGLLQVPYSAAIIAHERMNAFAYMSIYDVIMQLLITYLVFISPFDKLIFYGALLWLNAQIVRAIYYFYCKRNFSECEFRICYDKTLVKEIFSFSGWNFIGASSAVLRDQGNNLILNLFFGPVVNAARGIGNKIQGAVVGLVYNFITAMSPQITQSYSSGDHEYMFKLIFKGTRFAYYMMLFLSIPIIINADYILDIWLVKVPDEAVLFGQLAFIFSLISVISNPLITAQLATGNIKKYQIIVGGLQLLNVPISYICLKLGSIPQIVLIVAICCEILCLFTRLLLLKQMIGLDVPKYFKEVFSNIVLVTIVSIPCPIIIACNVNNPLYCLIGSSLVSFISTALSILYIGCDTEERQIIFCKVNQKFNIRS